MTPQQFTAKWADNELKESAASKEHFIDICALVGAPTPREADKKGEWFAFEKGVEKGALAGTGPKKSKQGFADVFLRGCFAWEYKGPHKNLDAAYAQLQLYRDDLENPPLLVVSDMDRFVVRTNFNDMPVTEFPFTNEGIGSDGGETIALLKAAFFDPYSLKPGRTREAITEEVAERFGLLAKGLRDRGEEPHRAAHFLMKLVFCLFAEDVDLLPEGLFEEMIQASVSAPERFPERARSLFRAMAEPGGEVNWKPIRHFNGGLFADDVALALTREELRVLRDAAKLDWGSVEPAVFGTLFERSLDPDKRSQLGAQYTSKEDILLVVEPVLMAPLRREWERVRGEVEADATVELPQDRSARTKAVNRIEGRAQERLEAFSRKIRATRVLDPACGSGNFLYVSLSLLLNLEKEVSVFAGRYGRGPFFPEVGPEQVFGIERDPYAHELAQVSVWIGYLQWMNQNGFGSPPDPVLGPMRNVVEMDAILQSDEDGNAEPEWPEADVIVGNPPFIGGKRLRAQLTDAYVDNLFSLYRNRVARESDLVCYWFERARAQIEAGRSRRAGLLATQSIRGGANRRVLQRIKESGDIFFAESDREWVQAGVAVHVSMVGFDDGSEAEKILDGLPVEKINSDLTGSLDLTIAEEIPKNLGISFMGDSKGGPFEAALNVARDMLVAMGNPNSRPNSDVVRPWANGLDITGRPRGFHIVDFGTDMSLEDAALYEVPFEYVKKHVKFKREKGRSTRSEWWLHERPRVDMRRALSGLPRYLVTTRHVKHVFFAWLDNATLPDSALIAFARDDDYFFVMHSWAHELWARRTGTQLREAESGFRYTPRTCFAKFPFPEPTDEQRDGIAKAARRLDELRRNWLNPEGAPEAELKKRTLTNLYNARPTWLANAHAALDRAVYAAYGWEENPEEISEEELLKRLLGLNALRAEDQVRADSP